MKLLSILSLSLVLFSCGTTEEVITVTSTDNQPIVETDVTDKPQRNYQVKARIGKLGESDPFTIDAMRIDGNTLFATVTYSGGCAEHKFEVVGSPMIMKTFPPKRSVQIGHDANGDTCRGMVTRILEIDLTELAYDPTPGSEIVLMFSGWDEGINYILK